MCSQGKILDCIPIKTVCLVLAIINAIINGIIMTLYIFVWGILIMLIGLFGGGGGGFRDGDLRFKREVSNDDLYNYAAVLWFFILPLIFLLNFIFSAVLCNGVNNNKSRQVKAYFWYGVVCNVVVFITAVVMLSLSFRMDDSTPMAPKSLAAYLLVKCALRSIFLVLVHYTHKKVVEDAMFEDHVPLEEVPDPDRNTTEWRSLA